MRNSRDKKFDNHLKKTKNKNWQIIGHLMMWYFFVVTKKVISISDRLIGLNEN